MPPTAHESLVLLGEIMDHEHGLEALEYLRLRELTGFIAIARQLTRLSWLRDALKNPGNVRCMGLHALATNRRNVRWPAIVLHVRRPEDRTYPERVGTIAVYPQMDASGRFKHWRITEQAVGVIPDSRYVGPTDDTDPPAFARDPLGPWPLPPGQMEPPATPVPPPAFPGAGVWVVGPGLPCPLADR